MNRSPRLWPLAMAILLTACQGSPALAPGAEGSLGPTGSAGANPGQAQGMVAALAGLGWVPATNLATTEPLAYRFDSKPLPGGPTLADLQTDKLWNDAFDPKVPGLFSAEGYAADGVATNATIETRGKSTRLSSQKSFRIALGNSMPAFRGEMDLLLNKHPYEVSRMRNKLAFDVFAELPRLMAPKTAWATLSLDGKDAGLYTQIERLDKAYLKRHQLDEQAMVYKGEFFEFESYPDALKLSTDPTYKKADFEKHLEITVGKDHAPLLAFLKALNDEDQPIAQVMAQHVNLDDYLTWFACNVLMDNVDTNSQNFYLYRSPSEGKWRFIPWDFDTAWGYYPSSESRSERHSRLGRSQEGAANWWGVALHRRVMQDPTLRAALLKRMDEVLAGPLAPARIQSRLAAYRPVVAKALSSGIDAEKLSGRPLSPVAGMEAEAALIPLVPQQAHERFLATLKRPMPVYLYPPRREGAEALFSWGDSADLQGDAITYNLVVATDPELTQVVKKLEGLKEAKASFALPAGTYFWTVEIKDATGEVQWPFDSYRDAQDKPFHGILRSEIS